MEGDQSGHNISISLPYRAAKLTPSTTSYMKPKSMRERPHLVPTLSAFYSPVRPGGSAKVDCCNTKMSVAFLFKNTKKTHRILSSSKYPLLAVEGNLCYEPFVHTHRKVVGWSNGPACANTSQVAATQKAGDVAIRGQISMTERPNRRRRRPYRCASFSHTLGHRY